VFPTFDGAIKFYDGLRNDDLMTLCVMGWPLYKEFGYIYHPEYTSVYADNEQTIVLKKMNKFAISDICIIKHDWTRNLGMHYMQEMKIANMYQRTKQFLINT
jgi:hypothetical protein